MNTSKGTYYQTLACSPAIINKLLLGMKWSWMTPILTKFNTSGTEFINATVDQASWFVSITDTGKIVGTLVATSLVDRAGRNITLCSTTIGFFLVFLPDIFVRDIHSLIALNFIFGIINGVNDVAAGIYITENCSPYLRGIMSSVGGIAFQGSVFLGYAVATYLSYRAAAITNAAVAACGLASISFGIETPYFLIMRGDREKAARNLLKLLGNIDRKEVANELREIECCVEEEKLKSRSYKSLFLSRANFKGIILVIGMTFLSLATGGSCYGRFASMIFASSEILTANDYTVLFGGLQFIAVATLPFVVEKMHRRSLVIGCFAGITCSNVCSYLLMYLHSHHYEIWQYPWLIFGSISTYGMLAAFSGPVSYALRGELLPLSVRGIGSSMAIASCAASAFLIVKLFLPITEKFGMETNIIIYSIAGALNTILLYCALPETKDKPLYVLQRLQEGKPVEGTAVMDKGEFLTPESDV